jgi:hypothetical protein
MRISLLMRREPFGRIAAETLTEYWRARTGKFHTVEWHQSNPRLMKLRRQGMQGWFGNIYLNFFAVHYVPDEAFLPLRNEYIRSLSWWRRWPQRSYVKMALSTKYRESLAQVALGVWPGVADAYDCIILGGNRRLRLLHPARRATTVVLKRGFAPSYLVEDARLRHELGARLSCAPRIQTVSLEQNWYSEELIDGIPANRLEGSIHERALEEGMQSISKQLIAHTIVETDAQAYVEEVTNRLRPHLNVLIERNRPLAKEVTELHECITNEIWRCVAPTTKVLTAMTHGDFQPANLLWNGEKVYVIDWECAARRLAIYDILFSEVGVRTRPDWSQSLLAPHRFARVSLLENLCASLGLQWSPNEQRVLLRLFLCELLASILADEVEPVFSQIGLTLGQQLQELRRAIKNVQLL